MCTSSPLSGEHPLLSLVVASYLLALPLYMLALCYDALVSRSYLHATLQPNITLSPPPITHCLFTVGLASLRHAQVVPSPFYQSCMDMLSWLQLHMILFY